ncbi:hypothetical protein AGMMS50262_21570 [Bacteroidia bacterium]|nr:hypothetical protein AGMMS50262_21570 [Bacteroidia bacterium]
MAKNGIVVYNQSFGYFDYEKTHAVQNSGVYDLASVTKATATLSAVMKLVDLNKIRLNEPLSKYIRELKHTGKAHLTIEDALYHETGLPAFLPFYKEVDTSKNIENQVIEIIANTPLKNQHRYLYSDLNFVLLKKLVETVSGKSLDQFTEQEFFAGLGAYSTTFLPLRKIKATTIAPTEYNEWRNRLLIGEVHDETAAVLGGVSGNAGLFSNANDLAKLLQLYLNDGSYGGKEYVSPKTARLFTQTQSPHSRRGLGFDKPDKIKETGSTSRQAPASTYGHTGFTGTCFWIDPDNQLIYIFLSNRVYPSRSHAQLMERNIRPRIHDIIYQSIEK